MTLDRRVVPFKAWHYDWLVSAGEAAEGASLFRLDSPMLTQLERQNSWTAVVDGAPIVCGGSFAHWPGRHQAWAFVARGTLRHLPWVTEHALRALSRVQGRIEFTVRKDFAPGLRWAKSLGFKVETPCLKGFGPEGEDHVGFVRFI